MTETTKGYVRGIVPENYGVPNSPELQDLLEAIDDEAFDAGQERGREDAQEDVASALADVAHELTPLLDRLLDVIHDYARDSIAPPDTHEFALTSLRQQIIATLDDIDPKGRPR